MNRLLLVVSICYVCLWSVIFAERKLPSFVNVCKRNDPNLSKCWEKTLLDLRPYLAKGIPEFNIPPTTSFRVDKLHLDQGNTGNINFVADLYNLTFNGVENLDVLYTNADFKNFVLREDILLPNLIMKGYYKAKGKVLLFEFEGEGDVEGEFGDVQLNGTWYFKLVKKGGKDHLQIDHDDLQVTMKRLKLYMHNLFKGNPEITNNVNNVINENSELLLSDFRPLLQTTLSTVLNQYFNRVYSLYPFDVLLPVD